MKRRVLFAGACALVVGESAALAKQEELYVKCFNAVYDAANAFHVELSAQNIDRTFNSDKNLVALVAGEPFRSILSLGAAVGFVRPKMTKHIKLS
jgi:hypothetical protein